MTTVNRLLVCAAAGALLVLGAVRVHGAPGKELLLDNVSFDRGEVSWRYWGDGDIREEYYGVPPHSGDFFLRIWSRSGWYQDFETKKDATYVVSAWVATAKQDALWGDAFAEVKVEWRNRGEDDVEVGQATSVLFDVVGRAGRSITPDEWTLVTLPAVKAPANATHGRVLVTIWTDGGDKGGGCALFDDINIKKTSP